MKKGDKNYFLSALKWELIKIKGLLLLDVSYTQEGKKNY